MSSTPPYEMDTVRARIDQSISLLTRIKEMLPRLPWALYPGFIPPQLVGENLTAALKLKRK